MFLTAAFVGGGDAYAPLYRSEYFNLSCHCLSHSSRDCIGCRGHQIPQSQAGRSPGKTETRGRTGNRGLRRIAKQKATDHRWLSVTSQTGLGLRGGSGSKQVGVVDFHIIGKGQLAGAADHSMVAVVPEQLLVGEGDISLRRFVPQRRIQVPTSYIFYKKKNPLMTVHQRVCRLRTILIRVTERTGRRERRCLRRSKTAPGPPRR